MVAAQKKEPIAGKKRSESQKKRVPLRRINSVADRNDSLENKNIMRTATARFLAH